MSASIQFIGVDEGPPGWAQLAPWCATFQITRADGGEYALEIACQIGAHGYSAAGHPVWGWDGDRTAPTLTPSILSNLGSDGRAHFFLQRGVVVPCGDNELRIVTPTPRPTLRPYIRAISLPQGAAVPKGANMIKIVIQPFVGLVLSESVDGTGGTVHGPKLIYVVRDGLNGKEYTYAAEDCRAVEAPPCCWAEHDAPPAERLYAAYNRAGGDARIGLTWNGQPVPSWRDLQARAAAMDAGAEGVLAKWTATAGFALDFLPPVRPEPPVMGWGAAFEAACSLLFVRRKCWPVGRAVTWQIPDENSKMRAPYLYQRSVYADIGVVCSPWIPLNEDMWARDWEIGTGEGA